MRARRHGLRREPRRLVLVDIENVAGGGLHTTDAAVWAKQVVEVALAIVPGEHVILGVSSIDGVFHAKNAWPSARVLLGLGRDGADFALLDVLNTEQIGVRFDHVAIVSGDGIFADAAAGLACQGVFVTAAGWGMCMASRLRLAAGQTVLLDGAPVSDVEVTA